MRARVLEIMGDGRTQARGDHEFVQLPLPGDRVVLGNESGDLERYPRNEREDAGLAAEAGADLLFAPTADEVYPRGFATTVEVLGLTDRLEGSV